MTKDNDMIPLHCRVSDPDLGDAGWVWYSGEWRVAQIVGSDVEDDDALYLEVILEDGTKWWDASDPLVRDLPWVPISRPPYDGNDLRPSTHVLEIADGSGSVRLSYRIGEKDGTDATFKIVNYARGLLNLVAEKPQT